MIVALTGPTCAGKTTVELELVRLGAGRAISHTTRQPRVGEVNGKHYHFVSDEEFERQSNGGWFIETNKLGSASYAKSELAVLVAEQTHKHVVMVVEPNGAKAIAAFCERVGLPFLSVWIDCDAQTQARRWVSRLTSDTMAGKEAAYAERLSLMLGEEQSWRAEARDNPGLYPLRLSSSVFTPSMLARAVIEFAENPPV